MSARRLCVVLAPVVGLFIFLLWRLVSAAPPVAAAPLAPDSATSWEATSISAPVVIKVGSGYKMWYQGRGLNFYYHFADLGLAESADGITWVKSAANPVLRPGDTGQWDDDYRGQLSVIYDGGLFRMWYSGARSSGAWQTGYATSADGLNWQIYAGNPVLRAGAPGSWDETEADAPSVIKDGALYKMWYHGCDAACETYSIGYATSSDGMTWSKAAGPVLLPTAGQWDQGGLLWPRVFKNGSTYELWYHSFDGTTNKLGRATSTDGIVWHKDARNPLQITGWDGNGVGLSSILLEGGVYKLWTSGKTGASQGIGYLVSSNGAAWTQPAANPRLLRGEKGVLLQSDHEWNGVRALSAADAAVQITIRDSKGAAKATINGTTDGEGWFDSWDSGGTWVPSPPDIVVGDAVSATSGSAATSIDRIGRVTVRTHPRADLIEGTIDAPFAPRSLVVLCEVWSDAWEHGEIIADADVPANGGHFACDLTGIADLTPGVEGRAGYLEPDGDWVSVGFTVRNELYLPLLLR